ncbi:hypothetical protein ILUMI_22532 [Ignelater luminosus]|uniref:Uncharacterized protein n=1 Tax=Ignelater luminosus TaxID=2038154 RepID=A0A8K0CGZ9_IGNLU|nr:hypothetical protein ILUMI_22532 [Ignelater luminosus]
MSLNTKGTTLNVIMEDEEVTSDTDDKYVCSDDELQEIKYIQIKSPEEAELLKLAQKLLEEFDTLGVCEASMNLNSEEEVYLNLIVSGFNLVNNHRRNLTEINGSNATNTKLKEDKVKLEKQTDMLKQTVREKDEFIESLNKKMTLKNIECEDLHKKVAKLQHELNCIKKHLHSRENEWEHKIRHLQVESNSLRSVAERSAGSFTPKDLITASIIQKYKTNEESYKHIIKKLQDNNHGLLEHLLLLMHNSEASKIS